MAESVIKGKRKGFTMIYNSVLKDTRLDLKTKGFFAVMMSFPEEWEYTIKGLMQIMGIGKDAVHSCLKQLESAGYLIREQCREGGRFSKNVYVLLEESASPLADLPDTVKPAPVLPDTENPPQYKTIENKDNNNIPPISPLKISSTPIISSSSLLYGARVQALAKHFWNRSLRPYELKELLWTADRLVQRRGEDARMGEDDMELLEIAFIASVEAGAYSLSYLRGVYGKWHENGILTSDAYWTNEVHRRGAGVKASQ